MLFDAHNHIHNKCFDLDRDEILSGCEKQGIVGMLSNGTSPKDWAKLSKISLRYPEILPAYGVHPLFISDLEESWRDQLRHFLVQQPKACVGEIGLDKRCKDKSFSESIFFEQLELSEALERQAIIHCVGRYGRCLELIKQSNFHQKFLLHGYAGSIELIPEFIELGAWFSVNASICYKGREKLRNVVKHIPLDRILIETDSPDMHPSPLGDERNLPTNLGLIIEKLAEVRATTVNELETQTYMNSCYFYQL